MVQIQINIEVEEGGTADDPKLIHRMEVNTLKREDARPDEVETMLLLEQMLQALINKAYQLGGFAPLAQEMITQSAGNEQEPCFTYYGLMTVRPMMRGTFLHGLNGEGLEDVLPEGDYMVDIIAVKEEGENE